MDDNRRIDSARTVSTSINTSLLLISLVSIVVILGIAHVLDRSVAHQILEPRSLVVQSWLDFFDLNSEASIGSWFSSGLWLVASVLAFAKGQQVRRQRGPRGTGPASRRCSCCSRWMKRPCCTRGSATSSRNS